MVRLKRALTKLKSQAQGRDIRRAERERNRTG